ncbi:unnamed protein product [Orchesella dallaii]|uniref:Uncharacterized protein n=1 Tax=Orchesella dallaii TaxID=48710 RepID=A0ABP1Q0Y4_9HEXA
MARHNSVYLASPTSDSTRNNHSSNTTLTPSKTDQQQQPVPSSNTSFPTSVVNLLDVASTSSGNQNHVHSCDDDDGGDEQDDESDSTECSSSDSEDNASSLDAGSNSVNSSFRIETDASQDSSDEESLHSVFSQFDIFDGSSTKASGNLSNTLWPKDRPLPFPRWDNKEPQVVHFKDILEYEEFARCIELVSQQTVATHKYNTVGNYIR